MSEKIGIIVGTNRTGALSLEMANYYKRKIEAEGNETVMINLQDLPESFAFSALYHNRGKDVSYNDFQTNLDAVSKAFIFVPEYNGSFPGVLKTFIDGLRYPDSLLDKKIALVGLSSGVQGNAIGLSHLDDILSYMGANVLGLRVKLGEIAKHFDGKQISNLTYEGFINEQVRKLLAF
ncbi:NADPH-dependent FMN reductase [Arcticibacterium luteifluviistationis]|uniref:NADPH-dependent FMN reductase n=1 Tax=Arcticibacterium luteifluviistationis TaxID=1784714 RepID=A0A2Z4G9A9_9BACT|nr:NADPH-dependent FMN reductase [Arcticibacterium luteifluviistationis]AWV97817.1 NADPH-dependent FMN reductase [Arcticibacterium luteifluviistationis]